MSNANAASFMRSYGQSRAKSFAPVLADTNENMEMARFIMSLRASGLRDTALMSAFEHVPRAEFFDSDCAAHVYSDISLPLSCGEEASSPHKIARVLSSASITREMDVLEIGTGSGFQAALLSLLAKRVVSIDRYRTLATLARKSLSRAGFNQIDLRVGDGLAGYDLPRGIFGCIIVNGAVAEVPEALLDRLAPGGALVLPLGNAESQVLTRIEIDGAGLKSSSIGEICFGTMKQGRALAL